MNDSSNRKRTLIVRRRSHFAPVKQSHFALATGQIRAEDVSKEEILAELKRTWIHIDELHTRLRENNQSLLRSIAGWKSVARGFKAERDYWQQAAASAIRESEEAQEAMMQLNSRTLAFMEARRDTIALLRDEFHVVIRDYNAGYMESVQRRIERLYEGFDAFIKVSTSTGI